MANPSQASTFGDRIRDAAPAGIPLRSVTDSSGALAAIHQTRSAACAGPADIAAGHERAFVVSITMSGPDLQSAAGAVRIADLRDARPARLPIGSDMLHLYLDERRLAEILRLGCPRDQLALHAPEGTVDPELHALAGVILQLFDETAAAPPCYADNLLLACAWHIVDRYADMKVAPHYRGATMNAPRLRLAKKLLSDHSERNSVEDVAAACGLSAARFTCAFKTACGAPPAKWANRQRVERSKYLLFSTRLPLGEIADTCGFADQSHFTRSFVTATGYTPTHWRRERLG